ncbi:hypothetical protein ACWCQZ_36425 [Streptomyces sp. NPDC002285]
MAGGSNSYQARFGEARGVVVGEGNTIIQQFVTGIDRLPTRYDPRITNFLTAYLGTSRSPRPFGGRDGDLARLDDWLADDSARPYLLLCAAGGRGKSALLVHWARRLLAREETDVVFVPVSIRYRTNLPNVFFPALAARLATVHGEDPPAGADRSPDVWEGVVADYMARVPPKGKLVVVLDGLDEAADWELGPHVLPADPLPGLRVVVSARTTAERPEGRTGCRRSAGSLRDSGRHTTSAASRAMAYGASSQVCQGARRTRSNRTPSSTSCTGSRTAIRCCSASTCATSWTTPVA